MLTVDAASIVAVSLFQLICIINIFICIINIIIQAYHTKKENPVPAYFDTLTSPKTCTNVSTKLTASLPHHRVTNHANHMH
jgi:hypothetical protein